MQAYVYHAKHRSVSFTTQIHSLLLFERDEVTAGFKTVSSWLCLLNQSCYGYYKSSHDGNVMKVSDKTPALLTLEFMKNISPNS